MQRNISRRSIWKLPIGWGVVWLGLGLLLAAWPAAVLGQEPVTPPAGELSDFESDSFWFSDRFTGRSEQSLGGLIRGGFLSGPAVGRENGLFPVQFMPYSMWGNAMLFGDLRGFRDTQDNYGANVGGGLRYYVPSWDRIFGAYAYYDYDNTSSKLFRQVSFGAETYGAGWDMRLNTYFPTQSESKLLQINFLDGSQRFSGNNILYDQVRVLGTPMKGLQHELGVPIPGRFAVQHDVRLYAGWYAFDGEGIRNTIGWNGRLQGNVLPSLALSLEVTNDRTFDTNVVFGAAFSYGGYRQPDDQPKSQFGRMTTPVQRQFNVVVAHTKIFDLGLTALKPDGTPYFVEHVASSTPYDRSDLPLMLSLAPQYDPGAALGTYENPFLTIAEAQAAAGGDIVYVWTNSVYNNTPVDVSESNVRILGDADGVVHTIDLQPFGFVAMPRAVNNPNPAVIEARPLFINTLGNGVTLSANDSEFSGFQIGDPNDPTSGPAGHGVFGTLVNNVILRQVDLNFAQQDGVFLDTVNTVQFFRSRIFNAAVNGLHVDGGRSIVLFEGDGDPASPDIVYNSTVQGGSAVLIENTLAGSFVDLFGANPSAIDYTNAGGIIVRDAAGSARFGDINIRNTTATLQEGINLTNNSGAYTFSSPVQLTNTFGDGINIETLLPTGVVSFLQPVSIVNRGGKGVDLLDIQGSSDPTRFSVTFRDDLNITTASPANYTNSPAIEYQSSTGNVAFQDITIDGGADRGIRIGDPDPAINNSGQFVVRGLTAITDIAFYNIDIVDDDAVVTFNGVSIDGRGDIRGADGIRILDNREPITFNGRTTVGNSLVANNSLVFSSTAVNIEGNTDVVFFENLTVTGAYNAVPFFTVGVPSTPSNSVAGVRVFDNPSTVQFGSLSVTTLGAAANVNNAGVALGARFVGDYTDTPITGGLIIGAGNIASINATAVDVQASVMSILFDSVSALNPVGPGILLANNVGAGISGDFTVLGNGPTLLFPGGTISGATQPPAGTPLVLFSQINPPTNLTPAPPLSFPSGAGILLRDTGTVVLNDMLIQSNQVGIDSITDALFIDASTVQNNLTFGLDALNNFTLEVTNSTFTGNGPGVGALANNNEIRARASLLDIYNWRFDNNLIRDAENSAVLISNFGVSNGSLINLTFTNNDVTTLATTVGVSADLDITWNGVLNALIDENAFQALGPLDFGVNINTTSATDLATVTITDNTFQGTGLGNVGINVTALGPSSYLIDNNVMQHNNPAAAMRFFLASNSATTISNNTINILGEQSSGIVFTSVSAPASVRIQGNDLTINGTDLFLDEIGIDFQATSGIINFFGDDDNIITLNGFNGFNFPYFVFPINGQFNGSILVNGAPQP